MKTYNLQVKLSKEQAHLLSIYKGGNTDKNIRQALEDFEDQCWEQLSELLTAKPYPEGGTGR